MSFLCFDQNVNEISLNDTFQHQRSFLYGDGHFTTMKVIDGQIQFLSSHIERLKQANTKLKFNTVNWDLLESTIIDKAKGLTLGFIKVHFSRGQSLRGYGNCSQIQTNVFVSFDELSAPFVKQLVHPDAIKLTKLSTQLGLQPMFAGIKHCNRLEQVMASAELEQSGCSDGLVSDIQGNLVETTKANVLWLYNSQWHTSELTQCGVEGVMLSQILNTVSGIIKTRKKMEFVIQNAKAMVICNSLIGVQAVSAIDDRILSLELSQKFMEKLTSV